VTLDAGVFISLDSPSKRRIVVALIQRMQAEGVEPVTNEAALAQAWRDPGQQVPMAMLAKATTVHPFGDPKVPAPSQIGHPRRPDQVLCVHSARSDLT
jgi:hypothetical protein